MTTLKITPVANKLPQVRQVLEAVGLDRWHYTIHRDGTLTIRGLGEGALQHIALLLNREGLVEG